MSHSLHSLPHTIVRGSYTRRWLCACVDHLIMHPRRVLDGWRSWGDAFQNEWIGPFGRSGSGPRAGGRRFPSSRAPQPQPPQPQPPHRPQPLSLTRGRPLGGRVLGGGSDARSAAQQLRLPSSQGSRPRPRPPRCPPATKTTAQRRRPRQHNPRLMRNRCTHRHSTRAQSTNQ